MRYVRRGGGCYMLFKLLPLPLHLGTRPLLKRGRTQ